MKSTCRNLLSSSLAATLLALGGLGLATTAAAQATAIRRQRPAACSTTPPSPTNGGNTWSPPVNLTNNIDAHDGFNSGDVVNVFYDRRNDVGNNLLIDYYARKSLDGGLTWNQPSVRLSDASTPVYLDPNLANCYHGDYDQQFQDANFAYIQWSDDCNVQNGHNDPDVFFDKEAVGTPAVCGDGSCDAGESECSCAADCGPPRQRSRLLRRRPGQRL